MSKATTRAWKEVARSEGWNAFKWIRDAYSRRLRFCDCCGEAAVEVTMFDGVEDLELEPDSYCVQTDEDGDEHLCFDCYTEAGIEARCSSCDEPTGDGSNLCDGCSTSMAEQEAR